MEQTIVVMKNPVVIALLNFFLPGLGYIVLGREKVFGALALIGSVAGWVWSFTSVLPFEEDSTVAIIAALLTVFYAIAFAYDGYMLAKEEQLV